MTKIEKFRQKFYDSYEGAAFILSPENRFYLTGFSASDGVVLVTPSESYFIVDFRYYEAAKEKTNGFKIVLSEEGFLQSAKEICEREEIKALAVEDTYITLSMNKRITETLGFCTVLYLGTLISDMRAVKTFDEIDKIAKAQEITDEAFSYVLDIIKPTLTENDVAAELEHYMRRRGAEELAFKTIAVSGKKSSLPHGEPSCTQLTRNSFLTLDFGAKLDGYCSDMTRTVVIGHADDEMRAVYSTVLRAQEAALASIHAGVTGSEVDAAARDIITEAGWGKCFGHSTGHSLGIEVHESPSYSPNYKKTIPEGAVLSVEPGIYIEGKFGVRIEDIAVVGENKAVNLTKSDKNLIEI